MLKLKFYLTIALLSVQTIMSAQEICNNAIDDDNDGLVDLNDGDCSCSQTMPLTDVTGYICRDNLRLILEDQDAISYQWYKDGVAIIGEDDSELLMMETPTIEGIYEVMVTTANGCYTSEPYDLKIETHEVYLGEEVICDGDTIFFGGFALTFEGFFQNNSYAVDGCDSITTLNVVVSNQTFGVINGQICDGELFEYHNISTTTPGTYYDTIPNLDGCDSLITVNLTEGDFQERAEFATICSGELFEEYGISTTVAGIHEILIDNPVGCDTLLTLTLEEEARPTQELNASICEGETYTDYGLAEISSGMYPIDIPASTGCDTLLTINLSVEEIPTEYIQASICDGDVYGDYGLSLTDTGIYDATVDYGAACDSIITIDLIVSDVVELNLTAYICEGEEYDQYGIQTSVPGPHQNTIEGSTSCDSIINLFLHVGTPSDSFLTEQICGSEFYDLYDIHTDSSGIYQTVIPNSFGCDSTITVNLEVLPELVEEEVFYSICEGESLELNNQLYYEEDIYTSNFITEAGCDSLLIINLTVDQQPTAFREAFICKGETFEYNNIVEDEEGVYDFVVENTDECDSLVTIQLFVIEPGEGVELNYYNTVSYGNTIDISPNFMGEGVTNITWMNDEGEEIGEGPVLKDFMTLEDTFVNLVGIDGNGCPVSARALIDVSLDINIFIPTLFTPDSEDDNKTFQIFGGPTVVNIREIAIYDRWGEMVYTATDAGINETYEGWDGYFLGDKVIAGAYAYIIDFDIVTGAVVTKTGTVTVVH